jgi:hypothetical protein
MSPSEADLRAALQHGDDGNLQVNADAVIAEAQAIRARRVRILSGTAAAVLVAAGAVGLAVIRSDGSSPTAAHKGSSALSDLSGGGQRATVPQQPEATRAPSDAVPAAGGAHRNASTTVQCPNTPPRLLVPGGGGTGQFGANDPLFAQPVDTLVVCSFSAADPAGTAPGRFVLAGRDATQVVAGLEGAHETPNATVCDPGPTSTAKLLALIGVTADGTAMKPVTATVTQPACGIKVTNGTAVRYGWTPPAVLTAQLNGLTPPRTVITVPDEPNQGSPIHS